MTVPIADRVLETSTTTGTGSLTLAGALAGHQSFNSAFSTGASVGYCIEDGSGWEVGIGTFTSPSTLARTTVLASSNAGAAVSFGATTKRVFCTLPASILAFSQVEIFTVAMSDLVTAIATGTGVAYFDAPFACTLVEVIGTVVVASTSGLPQFAVKKNGTTSLSTNITIDATETSSLTAATAPVISVPAIAKGDRMTFDIVAAGAGAKGAQVTLVVTRP